MPDLRPAEAGDEVGVRLAGDALLQDGEDARHVLPEQRCDIEPQAGEDLAADDAVGAGGQGFVPITAQDEPVEGAVLGAPDDVLADPVTLIDAELQVPVDADA